MDLPDDIFHEIIESLDLRDRARLRRVCRRTRAIVDEASASALATREAAWITEAVEAAQARRGRRGWGLHDAIARRAPLWAAALGRTGLARVTPWGSRQLVAVMDAVASRPGVLTRTTHLTLSGISARRGARLDATSSPQWLDAAADLLEHHAAGLVTLRLCFKRPFRSALPEALGRLPALAELQVEGAGPVRLPSSLAGPAAPRLRCLALVQSLPVEQDLVALLAHQVHLRSLRLTVGDSRGPLDGTRLAPAIRRLVHLEELHLDRLPARSDPLGIVEHPTLTRLVIGDCSSPDDDALRPWAPTALRQLVLASSSTPYPDSLWSLSALQSLTLANNAVVETLPLAMSGLGRLESLDLSNLGRVEFLDGLADIRDFPGLFRLRISDLPRLMHFPWALLLERSLEELVLENLPRASLPNCLWRAERVRILGEVQFEDV